MYDGVPDVAAGSYFDQANLVGAAEDLQDFRRRQEGHLIIADDRPLLVMAFGNRYDGPQAAKYKIEGKYDIPIGYKVIIKWDEDEIVFMTRQGTFGPEYQIVFLPKSAVQEDFTVFEWNPNLGEIWDQFVTVCVESRDDRDMKLFNQGPWHTFGVKRDEVQIALKQGVDNKTKVDGVLYCANLQTPDLVEHMRYLGYDPNTDEDFVWIFHAFKDEPKPNHSQWVDQEGRVYWVSHATKEPTWTHPHYEKYTKMLHVARQENPYPKWQHVMAFQIQFMFNQLFPWQCEETGEYPLVETIDNVWELARIFRVDIKSEPYLVHVLRRALRHYGQVVKEKRKVKDVEDFRNLMLRYRDLVAQYERQKETEANAVGQLSLCVQCSDNGQKKQAVLFCDNCRDFFCQGCFDKIHARGRRKNHRRTWVEISQCVECGENTADFHCTQCSDLYCRDCFQEWHVRGGRRNHIPIVLRGFNSQTDKLAEANYALATKAAQEIAKARSTWFIFDDENGIKYYYDVKEGEAKRDMPLCVINEPIDESVGGGMSHGWAGSMGANMFPDALDSSSVDTGRPLANTAF